MELKDLKDFYEKQEYYHYEETQGREQVQFNKRVDELTFFVNIAAFSVVLVILTYVFMSMMTSLIAVPLAFVLALVVYLGLKKGIRRAVNILMK